VFRAAFIGLIHALLYAALSLGLGAWLWGEP
jgi:hypothetical protein